MGRRIAIPPLPFPGGPPHLHSGAELHGAELIKVWRPAAAVGELLPKRFPAAHGAILGEEERPLPLREGATRGEERRSASALREGVPREDEEARRVGGRWRRHRGGRGRCRWRSLVLSSRAAGAGSSLGL